MTSSASVRIEPDIFFPLGNQWADPKPPILEPALLINPKGKNARKGWEFCCSAGMKLGLMIDRGADHGYLAVPYPAVKSPCMS